MTFGRLNRAALPLLAGAAVASFVIASFSASPAQAQRIHTGGEAGAYHRDFCPPLARELLGLGASYTCTPSSGTRDNMERVANAPRDFGYGQLDVFTLERERLPNGASAFEIVRQDDARECVFAVTRNPEIVTYGDLAARAPQLRFSLPPQSSGSAGTFQYLRSLDANGLGRSRDPAFAADTDDAIRTALARADGVAFFVQFPDPDNDRFRMVRELGGHFVPVLDKSFISSVVGNSSVYIAQETRVTNRRLLELGARVTTACTPLVLFTGNPERVRNTAERRAHSELINAVKRIPLDTLVPNTSVIRTIGQRTRELTAEGRERLLAYSARARDRALPFIERMIERAAPR